MARSGAADARQLLARAIIVTASGVLNLTVLALVAAFASLAAAITLGAVEAAFGSTVDMRRVEPRHFRLRLTGRPGWRNGLWILQMLMLAAVVILSFLAVNYPMA